MTQTMQKLFNIKMEMVLLLLFWPVYECSGLRSEASAAVIYEGNGGSGYDAKAQPAGQETRFYAESRIYKTTSLSSRSKRNNENDARSTMPAMTLMPTMSPDKYNGEIEHTTKGDVASSDTFPDVTMGTAAEEPEEHNAEDVAQLRRALQQQLIYEFALKYKQISRVTFLTCKSAATATRDQEGQLKDVPSQEPISNYHAVKMLKGILMPALTVEAGKATEATTAIARTTTTAPQTESSMPATAAANATTRNHSSAGSPDSVLNQGQDSIPPTKSIFMRVVHIDHLTKKQRNVNSNNMWQRFGGSTGFRTYGRSVGGGGRNPSKANWLDQVLRTRTLRQIVALNLACGAASFKLLEMASNKALFNSTYHWLLIEDYSFNRQAAINEDEDDIANNNGNYNSNSNSNNRNKNKNRRNREVVVNKDSATAKKQGIDAGAPSIGGSRLLQDNGSKVGGAAAFAVAGNRQWQRSSANGASAGNDNASDVESIEKFLEKINININTELILAKRKDPVDEVGCSASGGNANCNNNNNNCNNNNDNANETLRPKQPGKKQLRRNRKDSFELYDVWSPGLQYGGELNISLIGRFSPVAGFEIDSWHQRTTSITRRLNMKLARIRCLIVITNKNRTDTMEEYLTTHYDMHLDSMNRFNFALLSFVRDLYNFSFVLSKTASWGYLKNGKFDGMIGALTRKQADIGGSPIFFRLERAKVVDYTTRTWIARPCFMFLHPRSTKKDRIVFLQPFSNDVWVLVASCGTITILLLWLLAYLEGKQKTNPTALTRGKGKQHPPREGPSTVPGTRAAIVKETTDGKGGAVGNGFKRGFVRCGNAVCGQKGRDASRHTGGLFLESVLFYVGSICQQGLEFSTSLLSGRCIVFSSLLFSFSIYQFYSASIVGTLLMEKPKTIHTLRDLIHSTLDIGVEDIVYNREYFLRTKDPDAQELYAKKVTNVPMNSEQGFLENPENMPVVPAAPAPPPINELSAADKRKKYRDIVHSHETGAHAKTNEASNWYDPETGLARMKQGKFAFHVDVATAYRIIAASFTEKEICDLTEIQLFPPQKMVSIVQKGSPLRKIVTYGLRRATEVGLLDYQRKIWHSPKPPCVKQIHIDDLRVDMQTFTSALLLLLFGYVVSLLTLGLEILHHRMWQNLAE